MNLLPEFNCQLLPLGVMHRQPKHFISHCPSAWSNLGSPLINSFMWNAWMGIAATISCLRRTQILQHDIKLPWYPADSAITQRLTGWLLSFATPCWRNYTRGSAAKPADQTRSSSNPPRSLFSCTGCPETTQTEGKLKQLSAVGINITQIRALRSERAFNYNNRRNYYLGKWARKHRKSN